MTQPMIGAEVEEDIQFMDVPEPFEEPTDEALKRHAKRSVSAAGTAILGLPGDLIQTLKGVAESLNDYFPQPEFLQRDPNFAERGMRKLLSSVPTGGDIKESLIAYDPTLAPQNEMEELSDEIVADFAVLALPVKGKIPFVRALGTSVFANMAKEGAKGFGAGEAGQATAKIGAMFVSGMIARPGANKTVSNLYDKADKILVEGAEVNAGPLLKEAANIEKQLSVGASTPTKEAVAKFTSDVRKNIDASGVVPMKNVAELRRNLNELRGDPKLLKQFGTRFNAWDKALSETAETYGKENPRWLKAYKEANSAFGALKKSDKAVQNILKAVDPEHLGPQTSLALGIGGAAAAGSHLGTAALVGGSATGYRLMQRIATNPSLRRHYMDIMKDALNDNQAGIVRSVQRFDKEMKKSLEKEPIEFLDLE